MCEPPSHEPHSQQSQPEPNVQQKNAGSMGGGQQAAIGDRNVQVQGKGNWVWNFFFGWGGKSLTPRQEYRNRQALLNKVNNSWVKGVLEKTLYNQVLIELGLEEHADAVVSPCNMELETTEATQKSLPKGTKVISIFDQLGEGRTLLILGEPGSGKTTSLLELTRDLLNRSEQGLDYRIPVVFNLSSWAGKKQTIADWLVAELNSKYQVPKQIGQDWVEKQELLPLLDGLDEVNAERRDSCVAALNNFNQNSAPEMVVCSRIKDYSALSNRLNFQSAIYLKSLTQEQVVHYLDNIKADLTGLRALIEEDRALQELAKSPLMLNIMVLAYEGVAVEELPKTEVVEEQRKKLFDAYIERMFNRPNRSKGEQRYSEFQTKHWLSWLAQRMLQESQTVFFIEGMQPRYLKNKFRQWQYWVLLFIMNLVTAGTIATIVILQWFLPEHSISSISNRILLFGSWFGFILSTESKADASLLIMYPIVQVFCCLFRKKLPREFQDNIPILHDIDLSSRFRLKAPSLRDLKDKVLLHSLGHALLISKWTCKIFLLPIIIPIHILFGELAYAIGMQRLGSNSKKYFKFLIKRSIAVSNEVNESIDSNQNSNYIILFAILDQYGDMIKIKGGLLINLYLKILTFIPGLMSFIFHVFISLFNVLTTEKIEDSLAPNYRVKEASKTAFLSSILFCLSSIIAFQSPATYYRVISCILGFLACLSYLPLLKHLSLRLVLWHSGAIPWNYAHFLDYAAERIFLQKVGGGYIFIHRMLMEHFAQMERES